MRTIYASDKQYQFLHRKIDTTGNTALSIKDYLFYGRNVEKDAQHLVNWKIPLTVKDVSEYLKYHTDVIHNSGFPSNWR